MPREIDRDGLIKLIDGGAHVVEVLPPREYEEDHLPGAINLPLRRIEDAKQELDTGKAVVVYCWDAA